ncbi:MAG: iron-sulfur cluster assembly accessory protein [Candidatus Omnitrophica bacterium]|nr:iron-sulfur cluster assembly accessory protein [Candidatus Omnitrophota bacterium]
MISVTSQAIKEVKRLLTEQTPREGLGLRVGVRGGGCSGLSYSLNFDVKHEGDNVFREEGTLIYVDPKSLLYLEGMTLDFSDSLQGRGFKFINPNASKTCGCGESFSV